MMTFWQRRPGLAGRRRLLRGAGLPDPPAPLVPFAPTEVDIQEIRAELERLAASLSDSVDEATGHALDNLVNAWSERWIRAAEAEHLNHVAGAETVRRDAAARTSLARDLWMADLGRLVEVGLAVEATLTQLVDEMGPHQNDDGPRGRHDGG